MCPVIVDGSTAEFESEVIGYWENSNTIVRGWIGIRSGSGVLGGRGYLRVFYNYEILVGLGPR